MSGAVIRVVPRTDSCGEAVVIGERNTVAVAVASSLSQRSSRASSLPGAHFGHDQPRDG